MSTEWAKQQVINHTFSPSLFWKSRERSLIYSSISSNSIKFLHLTLFLYKLLHKEKTIIHSSIHSHLDLVSSFINKRMKKAGKRERTASVKYFPLLFLPLISSARRIIFCSLLLPEYKLPLNHSPYLLYKIYRKVRRGMSRKKKQ